MPLETASEFQSTPPARGATPKYIRDKIKKGISIHAPREGGDPKYIRDKIKKGISIHAPREGGDGILV